MVEGKQNASVCASIVSSRRSAGVTYYDIRVHEDGQAWNVQKRYSDFVALERQLRERRALEGRPALPRAGIVLGMWRWRQRVLMCSCNPGRADVSNALDALRLRQLDAYLIGITEKVSYLAQCAPLYMFLNRSAYETLLDDSSSIFDSMQTAAVSSVDEASDDDINEGPMESQLFRQITGKTNTTMADDDAIHVAWSRQTTPTPPSNNQLISPRQSPQEDAEPESEPSGQVSQGAGAHAGGEAWQGRKSPLAELAKAVTASLDIASVGKGGGGSPVASSSSVTLSNVSTFATLSSFPSICSGAS